MVAYCRDTPPGVSVNTFELIWTPEDGCPYDKQQGTSNNSPFAIWVDLLLQQFISKSSQYTKYSGLSETFVEPKSLTQIIKKEF